MLLPPSPSLLTDWLAIGICVYLFLFSIVCRSVFCGDYATTHHGMLCVCVLLSSSLIIHQSIRNFFQFFPFEHIARIQMWTGNRSNCFSRVPRYSNRLSAVQFLCAGICETIWCTSSARYKIQLGRATYHNCMFRDWIVFRREFWSVRPLNDEKSLFRIRFGFFQAFYVFQSSLEHNVIFLISLFFSI